MHSFYRDPARRPMVMSSGAVACLAAPEMPCRKGGRSTASESCRLRRDEDARPHIGQELGAIHLLATCWCAPTFLAQVLVPVGRQPAARQGFARDGERRPRTARSLGARARQRRNPARLAGRQRLIGLRAPFRRSGKEETCTHAHMYSEGNSARDKTQTRGHAAMS